MKESDLYPPVRDWLRARGYEVHVEMFGADVVAVKDGQLTVVELKLRWGTDVCNQCADRSHWADFVYAAVGADPKKSDGCRYHGFGLLVVVDGKVRQRVKPRPQPWMWHKRHAYRMKVLTGRPEAMDHELAGLPACPQLRAQRLLRNQT